MDGPETVRKHQRVGKQEEYADPEEWRDRNKRFVCARVHGPGKRRLLLDADGVRDRENKLVFTRKRTSRGNTHTQELAAAAIHFEQLTRAAEKLLFERRAEPRGSVRSHIIGRETNSLRAQRENGRATWPFRGPLQRAASGRAINNFAPQ